ncbi:MAG: hypothetical protein R3B93_03435 [Bacteroidia bacterium]
MQKFRHLIDLVLDAIGPVEAQVDILINQLISDSLIELLEDGQAYRLTHYFTVKSLETAVANLKWTTISDKIAIALYPYHYFKHVTNLHIKKRVI